MKVELIGKTKVVMENKHGKNNYFAWPSVCVLKNGKIAVAASGYRYEHICPFGKAVISYSEDEGETYTAPAPVIDTPLDDRDAGIVPFGENGAVLTSFNNTVKFQRDVNKGRKNPYPIIESYLDTVTSDEEQKYLGSEYTVSHDNGVTFGEIYKSPITSPHGPMELHDGSVVWVGRTYTSNDTFMGEVDEVRAYKMDMNGGMEYLGSVPPIDKDGKRVLSCEPHAIELDNGTLLCHIRVQNDSGLFTIYQTTSADGGRTWTEPIQLLSDNGGSPAHILKHSSGVLVSTYGYRNMPFGIKVMFSTDNGKTWDIDHRIYENTVTGDLGYPCTVELSDGSMLTVFYAHEKQGEPAVILQQKWRMTE